MSHVLSRSVGADKGWKINREDGGELLAHVMGSLVGGLALGLLLAAVRWALGDAHAVVGLTVMLAVLASTLLPHRLASVWPQRRTQVPIDWIRNRPRRQTAFLWGVILGCGLLTYIPNPAFYGLLGAAVAQPAAWATLSLGALFGVARGGVIALAALQERRRGHPVHLRAARSRLVAVVLLVPLLTTAAITFT